MSIDNKRGLILGGEEIFSPNQLSVLNPASGEEVGVFVKAEQQDVDKAVMLAKSAQSFWSDTDLTERQRVLDKIADLIKSSEVQIARVLTLEQGKPLKDSLKEVDFASQVFKYYAKSINLLSSEIRHSNSVSIQSKVSHAPLGVVAGIVPWNYPVDLWAWKVAPAIAAGNAIIMKPPLETPLAAGLIAKLVASSGVPEGLLSDLPGGADIGIVLSLHPGINGISATCSTPAGISILRNAAESLKRVTLELGGNCPMLVLEDCDIPVAAAAAARRSFSNAGQICIAVNRIIVSSKIADEFVEALVDIVDKIAVGDGMDKDSEMGPVTTLNVKEKTLDHIRDAIAKGGVRVTRRVDVLNSHSSKSHFIAPAVIDQVKPNSKLINEETFGPAVGILRVDSTEEAVRIANHSQFGLAAYVFTSDVEKGESVAEQLEFGGIGVNINDVTELDSPFGGWKMSGIGRELGPEGLLGMTELKHIRIFGD
jgi:acyl-CoA reductase-like NAD-dependent aldehyde dehydrogenase